MSVNPTAIEYLTELGISWTELGEMPDEQKAFFALICLAQNDITTYSRLVVLANWEPTRDENVNVIATIQINSLLRVWSAKLFEFSKLIDRIGGGKLIKDDALRIFARKYLHLFSTIESMPGYSIARMLRNDAASHYAFPEVVRSLSKIDASAKCGYIMHESVGNSYYPFGEEVAFVGQLNRHLSGTSKKIDAAQGVRDWMNWNTQASRIAGKVLPDFNKDFVIPLIANKRRRLRKQAHWLEHGMVGTFGSTKLPLLMRKRDE